MSVFRSQVTLCDNLELPFRNECFDAVLSLAVIHHFATTERRVNALRELARILRIGGRVIITVWAFEQKHRRFESQDVLIPWQPSQSSSTQTASDEEDDEEFLPPYHAYVEDSTSSRSGGDGDSSSLSSSSPGESCYSFVRRAIQVKSIFVCCFCPVSIRLYFCVFENSIEIDWRTSARLVSGLVDVERFTQRKQPRYRRCSRFAHRITTP